MGAKAARFMPLMAYSARKVPTEEIRSRPIATPAVIALKVAQESGKCVGATPDEKDNTSTPGSSVSSKSSDSMLIKAMKKPKKKENEKKTNMKFELENITELNELMSGQTDQSFFDNDESPHTNY